MNTDDKNSGDNLIALINGDPEKHCTVENLHELCYEREGWPNMLSDEALDCVVRLLLETYDRKISNALILGYKDRRRQLIRDYVNKKIRQIEKRKHNNKEYCVRSRVLQHEDFYGDGEYTPPIHISRYDYHTVYSSNKTDDASSSDIRELKKKLALSERMNYDRKGASNVKKKKKK